MVGRRIDAGKPCRRPLGYWFAAALLGVSLQVTATDLEPKPAINPRAGVVPTLRDWHGGHWTLQSTHISCLPGRRPVCCGRWPSSWRMTPNILLIPGTSSLGHLRENLAAAELQLGEDVMTELDSIGRG